MGVLLAAVPSLVGALVVAGGPVMSDWSAGFQQSHPGISIRVVPIAADSKEALEALRNGRVQVAEGGFQRVIAQERSASAAPAGPMPRAIAVSSGGTAFHSDTPGASPALGVFVNAGNPIARLTLAELDAIYSTTRLRGYPVALATWGQLGLAGPWKDRPIERYGMSLHNRDGSLHGYVYFWNEQVMKGGEFKPGLVEVADTAFGSGRNRAFVEVLSDVARDPRGIAFAPFDFSAAGVKAVALGDTERGPFYAGSRDDVARRVYPLTMTNYIAVMTARGGLNPVVRAFVAYVLSSAGQAAIARRPGHQVPLPPGMAAAERAEFPP